MTKDEAYKAMVSGLKVRHENYSSDEYAFINKDGKIQTEDGCVHGKIFDEFWNIRQNWETGWSVV